MNFPHYAILRREKAYTVATNPFLLGILLIRAGIEINPGPDNDIQFIRAAIYGDLATVKSLLNLDPSLATAKRNGITALLVASECGHTAVVKELLKYGADMEERSPKGNTPLIMAVQNGNTDTVEWLILGRISNFQYQRGILLPDRYLIPDTGYGHLNRSEPHSK